MAEIQLMALGGLGETGSLNCMLYETKDSAFLVDCGLGFPEIDSPGANIMIPDFSCLKELTPKLKGLVLTHGHEDHVGAIAHLYRQFPLPIYATQFTQGVVCQKLKEAGFDDAKLFDLIPGKSVTVGDFAIEPIFVNHSILDTVALKIHYQDLKALHLTDFKIDLGAPAGKKTDLEHFARIGEQGLDLLLSDSTNALSAGWTESEHHVEENLLKYFQNTQGRLLACLFSSNVIRLQALINCARKTGRKVALTGRSTREYFQIAQSLQKLHTDGVKFLDVEDIKRLPDSEILVIVTGSQAEPRSVLQRISEEQFKPFQIKDKDTILMSSKMIPGNEGAILQMLNRLSFLGAHLIIEDQNFPIHASGHAKKDELKKVIDVLKPKYFIPIHGEYLHLKAHQELAVECGLKSEQICIALNGDCVALTKQGLKVNDQRETGRIFLTNDGLEITPEAIKKRKKMAWNGLVVVSAVCDQTDSKNFQIALESYGVIGKDEEDQACQELQDVIRVQWQDNFDTDEENIKMFLKIQVRQFFKRRFFMKPEVVVLLHKI